MTKNAEYTEEYLQIVRDLGGDQQGRRAARCFVQNSNAVLFDKVVTSTYVPRFYDKQTYEAFKYTAETTHGILCKVIQHYLDDPEYRAIFDYDPRIAELILLDRGYPDYIPIMRMDVRLDEGSRVCEPQTIDCNFSVLYSTRDDEGGQMDQWRRCAGRLCDFHRFEGTHFFMVDHCTEVAEIINRTL